MTMTRLLRQLSQQVTSSHTVTAAAAAEAAAEGCAFGEGGPASGPDGTSFSAYHTNQGGISVRQVEPWQQHNISSGRFSPQDNSVISLNASEQLNFGGVKGVLVSLVVATVCCCCPSITLDSGGIVAGPSKLKQGIAASSVVRLSHRLLHDSCCLLLLLLLLLLQLFEPKCV
jgi:hypothetical protein